MVQCKQEFQDALDAYIASAKDPSVRKTSLQIVVTTSYYCLMLLLPQVTLEDADAKLQLGVDWANRWQWDFANYRPLFHLARDKVCSNLVPLRAKSVLASSY